MKNVFLILACNETIFKKKFGFVSFPRLLKHPVFDQPTVDSVGVSRGRSVAVSFKKSNTKLSSRSNTKTINVLVRKKGIGKTFTWSNDA